MHGKVSKACGRFLRASSGGAFREFAVRKLAGEAHSEQARGAEPVGRVQMPERQAMVDGQGVVSSSRSGGPRATWLGAVENC